MSKKFRVIDNLIGDSLEGRLIKKSYLKLIHLPEKFDINLIKQNKPYIPKLMKVDPEVEDEARIHPSLSKKLVNIEQVHQESNMKNKINRCLSPPVESEH